MQQQRFFRCGRIAPRLLVAKLPPHFPESGDRDMTKCKLAVLLPVFGLVAGASLAAPSDTAIQALKNSPARWHALATPDGGL